MGQQRVLDGCSWLFCAVVGVAFGAIGVCQLLGLTASLLRADGIIFESLPVAGRAEIRAYYCGTGLALCYLCLLAPRHLSLSFISVILGGFAAARLCGYWWEGSDPEPQLRLHQHTVFALEVMGCVAARAFLGALPSELGGKVRKES